MIEPKRPRILHLTTTGAIAGAEQLLVDLSLAHNSSKWDVSYATLFPAGEMNSNIRENGASCYALDMVSAMDAPHVTIKLAKLIDRLQIDILHTHLLHGGLIGLLAAKLSGRRRIRLVHTRHHSDELHRFGNPMRAKVDGFVARSQSVVCANSLAAKAVLVNLEGVDVSKIRLTYPGIDHEKVKSRLSDPTGAKVRSELALNAEQYIVGSVAHLMPKKGHAYLIRAMPLLLKLVPNARLVIVGRGRESDRLKELATELGLAGTVQFLGYRSDVSNLINAFDIFVQPSLEEAFGISIVEAMALGKAVVATSVGGIPEVVEDKVTGILVPAADPDALSGALVALLRDEGARRRMGDLGRARVNELFTIQKHASAYESVWSEVLNNE